MAVEEGDPALDETQALPDAVAEHEAGIEDRDLGLGPAKKRAVHGDQHLIVAGVADIVLRTGGGGRSGQGENSGDGFG